MELHRRWLASTDMRCTISPIYICIYICIDVCVCAYVYIYTHTHPCIHVYMCIYINTRTRTDTHKHINKYTNLIALQALGREQKGLSVDEHSDGRPHLAANSVPAVKIKIDRC